jgi:uncharacterized protein YodC (DUF2158 family)
MKVSDGKVRCVWYDWNNYPDSFREMFKKNANFEMDLDDGSECPEFMEEEDGQSN